jgi:hypothetical protein
MTGKFSQLINAAKNGLLSVKIFTTFSHLEAIFVYREQIFLHNTWSASGTWNSTHVSSMHTTVQHLSYSTSNEQLFVDDISA